MSKLEEARERLHMAAHSSFDAVLEQAARDFAAAELGVDLGHRPPPQLYNEVRWFQATKTEVDYAWRRGVWHAIRLLRAGGLAMEVRDE